MQIMNILKTGRNLAALDARAVVADLDGVKMRLFRLNAGQNTGAFEIHPVIESLIVLEGKLIFHNKSGEQIEMAEGDSTVIEAGIAHQLEALEDTLGMVTRYLKQ